MSRSHVATPAERASVRDLELVARATVEGLRQGLHRSPFHGYNAEFSQYRHYRPGDDLKYVDWKAFGRTDRLFTRQFRETTNLSALFVCDLSRSMDYGAKFALAQAATAVLGTLVIDQGDAAGLLALGDQGRLSFLPARSGHHHLTLFLAAVARLRPEGIAPVSDALTRAAALLKRRGLVIVVSDFYDEERTLAELRRMSRMGHDVIAVHVISRDEITLPDRGAVEYVDSETGRTVVVQPERAQAAYKQRVEGWLQGVAQAMARDRIAYLRLTSRDTFERDLRRFLVARQGGG
jgi:uncharacterized protein (DUF58 family)